MANPYFKQKGDSKISVLFNPLNTELPSNDVTITPPNSSTNSGVDVQSAYAISNHVAFMVNYFNRKEKDTYSRDNNVFDTSTVDYKRNLLELGVGYYIALNQEKTITYNIYGGIGVGKFLIDDNGKDLLNNNYNRQFNTNIFKPFVQGSFNFMLSEYFKFSLGGRLSFPNYKVYTSTYSNSEVAHFYLNTVDGKGFTFFEPTINIQFGFPAVKWVQIETIFTACNRTPIRTPAARTLNFSLGLTADVGKIFKL